MSNYRKRDVINDQEINTFETIEINKIKMNIVPKRRRKLKLVLMVPLFLLAFIIGVNLLGGDNRTVNPALEGFELAEFNPISISDLPVPLQGVSRFVTQSNLMFLSNSKSVSNFLSFDDEPDVTGNGQLELEKIIENQEMIDEATEIFDNLYENIMYLTLDEVSSFDDTNEYYFVVNEDGTYVLTLQVETEDNGIAAIEALTFYQDGEYFYQVTYQVDSDEETALFKIVYNQDNTKKYQYARHTADGKFAETYVAVEQLEDYTNVVAIHEFDNVEYEIVGNANDDHGVIFIDYEDENGKGSSVEYYNQDGALLKHEWGLDNLDIFNQFLDELFIDIDANPEAELKNLIDSIPSFDSPETFVIEFSILDAALATTTEVDATLIVEESTTYNITYAYNNFLYTKQGSAFNSGDTIYHMTAHEVNGEVVTVTYSALYQLPEAIEAPNGESYYVFNRYMAKYIEAAEGYTITEQPSGKYILVNDELSGELGGQIEIEIEVENYFVDGAETPVTIFQHTCDVQFENIIFTEMDIVNAAKTNLDALYLELVPTQEELNTHFVSIDLSMFE